MSPPTRPCPLCEAERPARALLALPNMNILRCQSCRMMYTAETEGDFRTDEYRPYLDQVYAAQFANAALRRETFEKRIAWLEGFFARKPKTLELGLGSGEFARATVRAGWDYTALEPFPHGRFDGVRDAFRIIPKKAEEWTPEERYDLVVLDNVLEHIPQPVALLRKLRGALAPGGRLWIQVPNEKGFLLRHRFMLLFYERYPIFPAHVNLFTCATLGAMLERAGCASVELFPVRLVEPDLIRFLLGKPEIPLPVGAIAAALRRVPLDVWLGQYYWIDALGRPGER